MTNNSGVVALNHERSVKLVHDVVYFCQTGYFEFMYQDKRQQNCELVLTFPCSEPQWKTHFGFKLSWEYFQRTKTKDGFQDRIANWFYPFESEKKIRDHLNEIVEVLAKITNVKDNKNSVIEWKYDFDCCHGAQYIEFISKTPIDFANQGKFSKYIPLLSSDVLVPDREGDVSVILKYSPDD